MISAEYAAGLFDGEGCVTFYTSKTYVNPILVIAMSNREVLEACAARWGGRVHAFPAPGRARQMYHWRLFGKRSGEFAEDILPYLIVKRNEVLIVRSVLGTRGNVEEKRWAKTALAHARQRIPA